MMAFTISLPNITKLSSGKIQSYPSPWQIPRKFVMTSFPSKHARNTHLLCSKMFPWETSSYASFDENTKPGNMIESIVADGTLELPILEREAEAIAMKEKQSLLQQTLKWPMWLLGPSFLLVTGMSPTLWLPLPSVFLGPNIAGVLSLLGLDCMFNMGATLFLLMADACARPNGASEMNATSRIPFTYKFWNMIACLVGFVAPIALYLFSYKGLIEPHLHFIPFLVLFGPYLLLLSVQMLTEMLTWHWKSPVWLVAPVVYEGYRILQLMRGIKLGMEISAPGWAMTTLRGLVSWWVLILGIQLMRVAWFAGYASQNLQERS